MNELIEEYKKLKAAGKFEKKYPDKNSVEERPKALTDDKTQADEDQKKATENEPKAKEKRIKKKAKRKNKEQAE